MLQCFGAARELELLKLFEPTLTTSEVDGLESFPHVVWTFHLTGLLPTEQNFDGMPSEDQRECEAAWAQWDAMGEPERAQFATKMRAYVAALPA